MQEVVRTNSHKRHKLGWIFVISLGAILTLAFATNVGPLKGYVSYYCWRAEELATLRENFRSGNGLHPMPEGSTKELRGEAFMERKTRIYARAGLDKAIHLLKVRAWGDLAVAPALAPPTIFPLDPWMCALLTCDLAGYVSVMNWDHLADVCRRHATHSAAGS